MSRAANKPTIVLLAALLAASCEIPSDQGAEDGELDVGVTAGKADGPFTECELREALAFVNDPATTLEVLLEAGVHARGSRNIIAYRDTTDANHLFDTVEELDDVPYVGPSAFRALVAHVADRCVAPVTATRIQVIFSPQPYEASHLARVVQLIDGAQRSVDIAMYSFRDNSIQTALERAVARGVTIRMIYDPASTEQRNPQGTMSARLEDAGIEVRWINRVMHHKYAIIDGPRTSAEEAATAVLVTGSANWSNSAGTRYDENTVVVEQAPELVLRFQREFNHLWEGSRSVVWNEQIEHLISLPITDEMIVDDPAIDAVFTSANFEVRTTRYGPTFSVIRGSDAVSDRLVELIQGAQRSIHIASGHLRSRPVAEALIARHQANPEMDIRIYLDDQEYISASAHGTQEAELAACLEAAGESEAARADCVDQGFLFSYAAHESGIPLRYKYYAYRWDASYAPQMHHKYFVFDGRVVASGSYNLSDNAEHNTMENMVIYDGGTYPELAAAFEANFESIWVTGEAEGRYAGLLDQIENGTGSFPIVFDPMALDWDQVTHLRDVIRDNCPNINSEEYRTNAPAHRFCER